MKRRALTIVLSLAGIALLTAVGVQVYRSQRYVSFVRGVHLAAGDSGSHWDFEAGYLRPTEGKFRGWYLSVDLAAAAAPDPVTFPALVLTQRPTSSSRWALVETNGQSHLAHRGPTYDNWRLSFLPLVLDDYPGPSQSSWILILQSPDSVSWFCRISVSERGVRIQTQDSGKTWNLKPPVDAEVQTFDRWGEPPAPEEVRGVELEEITA
ncbi:MAG: hypothetical protein AAF488_15560 [Planctomycetota bacterium]